MVVKKETAIEKACDVVRELFPYHELSARRLMQINEAFRETCVDLSEARSALQVSSQTRDQEHEGHSREWKEIVDRLYADVSERLLAYEADLKNARR